jgi:hypothetical protein
VFANATPQAARSANGKDGASQSVFWPLDRKTDSGFACDEAAGAPE